MDLYFCRQRLRQALPELSGEPLTFLASGWDSLAVRVGGTRVARFARRADVAAGFRREARLLEALGPVLAPVLLPRAEAVCVSDPPAAGDFLLSRRLPGRPAEPASDSDRLAAPLAACLARLHAAPTDVLRFDPRLAPPWEERLATWLAEVRATVSPHIGRRLREQVTAIAERVLAVAATAGPMLAVVHADLTPDNLLVDPDDHRLLAVLDWTDATLADPALDLAVLLAAWPAPFADTVLIACGATPGSSLRHRAEVLAELRPLAELAQAVSLGEEGWTRRAVRQLEAACRAREP